MSIPAHKVVGDEHKPGQIVNTRTWTPPDQSLGDYLARKQRYAAFDTVALERINTVKKLSFQEWIILTYGGNYPAVLTNGEILRMTEAWVGAQENV